MSIFARLFRRKKPSSSAKNDFYLDQPFANPDVQGDLLQTLYQFLDFILTHVKSAGNVGLSPSYVYTYHLIQTLKEINHPILNGVLNRSIHWFMNKRILTDDQSFTTFKLLALFDFKHKVVQDYLVSTLPKILKNHVNSRQEIHLQAFDGYLTSTMRQEEDSVITGAHILLKFHENLLVKDEYFDNKGNSRLLKLVENSLNRAGEKIWQRQIHRTYLYNLSSFLYTTVLFREITGKSSMDQYLNKAIFELNFNQKKTTGLWGDDIFQSAFIFNNVVTTRRILRNDSRLETVFNSFYDNFLGNYNYSNLLRINVTHSNFLLMSALLQGTSKLLKNDDINDLVFRLKEKKLVI